MKKLFIVLLIGFLMQSASAKVRIDSINLDPAHIEAGDEIDIYVKFHESPSTRDVWSGQSPGYSEMGLARDNPDVFYIATLLPADDASKEYITILKGTRTVGHLFIGESWTTPFKVKVREDTPATSYGMEFQILKTDISGVEGDLAMSYKFDIPVKGIVKLNVKSGTTLKLGAVNNVMVSIKNNGGGIARHVTISSNVTGNVKTMETSEIYIGKIANGENKDVDMKLSVSGEAMTGAYDLSIQIGYVDSSGSAVRMNQTIGLWIEGSPDLDVVLDSADNFMEGQSGTITVGVINQGFIDTKFLTLEILPGEGYTVTSSEKIYIGSLSSDDTETEEFEVKIGTGVAEGKLPVKARVTFKDESTDRVYTEDTMININVLSKSEYAKLVSGNGGFSIKNLLAIPLIIVAYLVLWFIYKLVNLITGYVNSKIFKRV